MDRAVTHPVDIDALLESLPASGEYVAHAGTPVLWAEWWPARGEWRSLWRASSDGRPLPPEEDFLHGHWRVSRAYCLEVVFMDLETCRRRGHFTDTPRSALAAREVEDTDAPVSPLGPETSDLPR